MGRGGEGERRERRGVGGGGRGNGLDRLGSWTEPWALKFS